MSTATLAIPDHVLRRVREGAYGVIAASAEALSVVSRTLKPPEPESLERLLRAWALLERIGWRAGHDPTAVQLDASQYADAVVDALANIGHLLVAWRLETDDTASKSERAAELRTIRRYERIAKHARRHTARTGGLG
jgi:hypothetical protein